MSTVLGLVQRLKVYADVIVRVARKIDPVHWGLLFQEAGQPTRLFEKSLQVGCCPRHRKKKRLLTNVLLTPPPKPPLFLFCPPTKLQSRAYATAAGFLVIVETLEGPDSRARSAP